MLRAKSRKRPCRICRKWFLPGPRQQDRQRTCGAPECQRQWHRRQCARYNRNNRTNRKEDYLAQKLAKSRDSPSQSQPTKVYTCPPPPSRIQMGLPRRLICEAIGSEMLIIIEYCIEQVLQRQRAARCATSGSKRFQRAP